MCDISSFCVTKKKSNEVKATVVSLYVGAKASYPHASMKTI